jgi:hypothetical protein
VRLWVATTDREALAISEGLARANPRDTRSQIDLALACWGFSLHAADEADQRAEVRRALQLGRATLLGLDQRGLLSGEQKGWIREFDQSLSRVAP